MVGGDNGKSPRVLESGSNGKGKALSGWKQKFSNGLSAVKKVFTRSGHYSLQKNKSEPKYNTLTSINMTQFELKPSLNGSGIKKIGTTTKADPSLLLAKTAKGAKSGPITWLRQKIFPKTFSSTSPGASPGTHGTLNNQEPGKNLLPGNKLHSIFGNNNPARGINPGYDPGYDPGKLHVTENEYIPVSAQNMRFKNQHLLPESEQMGYHVIHPAPVYTKNNQSPNLNNFIARLK